MFTCSFNESVSALLRYKACNITRSKCARKGNWSVLQKRYRAAPKDGHFETSDDNSMSCRAACAAHRPASPRTANCSFCLLKATPVSPSRLTEELSQDGKLPSSAPTKICNTSVTLIHLRSCVSGCQADESSSFRPSTGEPPDRSAPCE